MLRYVPLIILALADPSIGQVATYEGCLLSPQEAGWLRNNQPVEILADWFMQDGWFVQTPVILDPGPPILGQQDFYFTDIVAQGKAGIENWFLAWVVITDGPAVFGNVAPASIVGGGLSGILYHFTIGGNEIRFLRDTQIAQVLADLEPGVPHYYYLELHGTDSYAFWIDSILIDSGVPEGAYPTPDSRITFGARASGVANETRWDWVRFGRIPISASGDFDSDGAVDEADYYFFDECFTGSGENIPARRDCQWADMDADTDVDCADAALFASAWTGAGDPIIPAPCGGNPPPLTECITTIAIPTVSEWGAITMTLLTITGGSLVFDDARRRT